MGEGGTSRLTTTRESSAPIIGARLLLSFHGRRLGNSRTPDLRRDKDGDRTKRPVSYTHLDVYKRQVPYGLYYLSRNMEHVLFDDMRNLSDEQKMDYADSFADRYGEDPIGFVAFMSKSAFAVSGSYRETWLFIKEGTNSLHRWSNLHLALPADSAEAVSYTHLRADSSLLHRISLR